MHTIRMRYDIYLDAFCPFIEAKRADHVGCVYVYTRIVFIHFWGLTNKRDQITNGWSIEIQWTECGHALNIILVGKNNKILVFKWCMVNVCGFIFGFYSPIIESAVEFYHLDIRLIKPYTFVALVIPYLFSVQNSIFLTWKSFRLGLCIATTLYAIINSSKLPSESKHSLFKFTVL